MTGFNAAVSRTAIGLAVNLPQFRYNDTYQFQNNLTYVRGNHVFKAGVDVRRQYVKSFFFPTIRGRLVYATLQRLRQRRRGDGHHQQAAARRRGSRTTTAGGTSTTTSRTSGACSRP